MADNSFFNDPLEQSLLKAQIVSSYFWAWAKIMISASKKQSIAHIAYVDLFAGPGRYNDPSNSKSTPILVLEKAIKDPQISQSLITIFNDKNHENAQSLQETINQLPGIDKLQHKPIVTNYEVGKEITELLEQVKSVPALFFIDPWGYKGLSLQLISAAIKDWGHDCIFFFNYNRINMALANDKVKQHMNDLFGEERAEQLGRKLSLLPSGERELAIVNEISQALQETGGKYVLPFCFRNKARTSHYLIFVSKHFKGYEVMKEVMAKHSSEKNEDVASFKYIDSPSTQLFLDLFRPRPLEDLKQSLLETFSGETLSFRDVYETHSVKTPYISKNYRQALKQLENEKLITVSDTRASQSKRRKGTFPDGVTITFP